MVQLIVCLLFAAVFAAIMDNIAEGRWSGWWNKNESWKYKWKRKYNIANPGKREWYYLWLYKPLREERFPYSSTMLVWLTDGWHFFKFLFNRAWQAAIVINIPVFKEMLILYIIIGILFSVPFEIVYKKIKEWR